MKFEDDKIAQVVEAYLVQAKSHRLIQREILNLPAPKRGGGFVVMTILHGFNIRGDRKGALRGKELADLRLENDPELNIALDLLESLIDAKKEAQGFFENGSDINPQNNPTESKSEIVRRVYQNELRKRVLANYSSTCAFCDIDKPDLLICSHIKPWAADIDERLNQQNAICFCAIHDRLFDRGYLSLDSDYSIIYGPKADDKIKKMMSRMSFKKPIFCPPDFRFLQFHYEEICCR